MARAATLDAAEDDIARMLAQRQALFDARGINVSQLSDDIVLAVEAGQQLAQQGAFQAALDRMLTLEKYMPLLDLPGYNLHLLCSTLYSKLGQVELSQKHMALAKAYGVLLDHRLGKGDERDPLRLVMLSEVSDWLAFHNAQFQKWNAVQYKSNKLLAITYLERLGSSQSHQLFASLDKRLTVSAGKREHKDVPAPAVADTAPSLEERASNFIALWRATCAKYYSNPLALRAVALKAGYRENPAYGDLQLLGSPGLVWDASPNPLDLQSLISLDNGTCEADAQKADAAMVEHAFAETMESFTAPGFQVEKSADEHILVAGVRQHRITYLIKDEAKQQAWFFMAGLSDDPLSFTQAIIGSAPYADRRINKLKMPFDSSGASAPAAQPDPAAPHP